MVANEKAVFFMVVAVDTDAGVVEAGAHNDNNFGVIRGHTVVFHNAGLDATVDQKAQNFKGGVGDNPDVDFAMVADAGSVYSVDISALPQLVKLLVGVDTVKQLFEFLVLADGYIEAHRGLFWP